MARGACDALFLGWCLRPESNRYARFHEAADFKSAVSTNFTTQAGDMLMNKKAPGKGRAKRMEARAGVEPTYSDLQSGT